MSAVMKVRTQHRDPSSPSSPEKTFTAVLKLYDRRFGTTLRRRVNPASRRYEPHMHTTSTEAAYCDFIRRAKLGAFLLEREKEGRSSVLPVSAWHYLDGSAEETAKYEAVKWKTCQEYFDRETRAYEKLSELQGKVIPRLFAHVRLSLPQDDIVPCPPGLLQRPETRQYFDVRGILMELVDGYELSELHISPLAPSDTERWEDTIQTAVDGAHEINRRGVRMSDCSMYNVMVDKESHHPFIVDLAQCGFIEEMYEEEDGEESGSDEEESNIDGEAQDNCGKSLVGDTASESNHQGSESGDGGSQVFEPDPEIRYWNSVMSVDNPGAIGAVMRGRLMREKGVTITPRWPDYDAIIADIRRKREQREP
ncbi:hypothetical protein INS49_013469 [Diaporthe citri]|uniref:uncharacterized protein n=1 Tax=Diaporthe citri TaxID=83186 RepID=UPI001C7E241B|nr:uncharacterized protein INS49_013469 [Diaporthe citri]KAG6357592.1 hypothetical protein INS49_013469 [Diaporthe citri]